MKVLVVSDIHSNWEAWQAVQAATQGETFDEIWCLGDLTGYGPDPALCVEQFRGFPNLRAIMGNHDRVVAKVESPVGFNPHAIVAAYKNMARLNDEQARWLAANPQSLMVAPGIMLCHGSPVDPDEYLLTAQVATPSFTFMAEKGITLALFGHTHIPSFYEWEAEAGLSMDQDPLTGTWFTLHLDGTRRYLINPGSVGQPRDGNPLAAFGILELTGEKACMSFQRVGYDIAAVQEKMRRDKFPDILVTRLTVGY
ncbi:MAG: hypothetical protein GX442_01345 [Candidatus Riflebacteria bacterium]|nr:hypothetical protein [Candidatus Riflebacteria bacterium]